MRTILHTLIVICSAQSTINAQPKTPAEFLLALPSPPKVVDEASRRCPNESDTVAQRWLNDVRLREMKEQSSIESDSVKYGNQERLPPVLPKEMNEYRSLQQEIDSQRNELEERLRALATKPSQGLLNAIRTVGEALDREIKNCPNVGPSKNPRYDSTCIALAEDRAHFNRLHEVNVFLTDINANWRQTIEPLLISFQSRENRIAQLLATTKHHWLFVLQLKRLRLETWQTITPIFKTIDDVTRFAVQFSR